jgi:hypothetical protein
MAQTIDPTGGRLANMGFDCNAYEEADMQKAGGIVDLIAGMFGVLVSAVAANAETSLTLDCKPNAETQVSKDPIVNVSVSRQGHDWHVTYIAKSGSQYERSVQYWLNDTSTIDSPSWSGTLTGRPYLTMIGRLFHDGDNYTYVESLYDDRVGNIMVMQSQAKCIASQTAPSVEPPSQLTAQPAPPSAAPSPQPSPQISSTVVVPSTDSTCSAMTDPAQRLACYDKAASAQAVTEGPAKSPPSAKLAAVGSECLELTDPRQRFACYETIAISMRRDEMQKLGPQLDQTSRDAVIHGACIDSILPVDFPGDYNNCLSLVGGGEGERYGTAIHFTLSAKGTTEATTGPNMNEVFDENGLKIVPGSIWFDGDPDRPTNINGINVEHINQTYISIPESSAKFANDYSEPDGKYEKTLINTNGTCTWREPFNSTYVVVCDVNTSVGQFHFAFRRGPFIQRR